MGSTHLAPTGTPDAVHLYPPGVLCEVIGGRPIRPREAGSPATARRTGGESPLARVRIDPHWHYHDLRAIVLENEHLRLVVLPETGAKIHALIDKKRDHDVLWHNPRLEPRRPVFGQNFDDWWSGGWDEVFPTCDVSTYQGETYPYLGELWSLPWAWEIAADGSEGVSLHLSR